jgi:hypothetical protein
MFFRSKCLRHAGLVYDAIELSESAVDLEF